jgi:hypothetical protein
MKNKNKEDWFNQNQEKSVSTSEQPPKQQGQAVYLTPVEISNPSKLELLLYFIAIIPILIVYFKGAGENAKLGLNLIKASAILVVCTFLFTKIMLTSKYFFDPNSKILYYKLGILGICYKHKIADFKDIFGVGIDCSWHLSREGHRQINDYDLVIGVQRLGEYPQKIQIGKRTHEFSEPSALAYQIAQITSCELVKPETFTKTVIQRKGKSCILVKRGISH